jgi:hypothetical protein
LTLKSPAGKTFTWFLGTTTISSDSNLNFDDTGYKAIWPLRIGKSASYNVGRPNGFVGRHVLTVERAERVRVPAGEFDCLVVSNALQSTSGYADVLTYWYAPALGAWVRRTWELKAGTPAQPQPPDVIELVAFLRPAS